MVPSVLDQIIANKVAGELRATWQGRALAAAQGTTGSVLLSVLAHNYDQQMAVLLRAVFPSGISAKAILTSAGRVMKNGAIVADVGFADGRVEKKCVLYRDEIALRDDFRRLADRLHFSDADRTELFAAVKKWVVADYRLDPAMDPNDPDAKRLVH